MARKRVPEFGEDEETEFLAKAMALLVFREPLERESVHGGVEPESMTGDYSDVKVVTPYGEIPWNMVRRISDDDMKSLMVDVVSRLFTVLSSYDDKAFRLKMIMRTYGHTVTWDKPEIHEVLRDWVRNSDVRSKAWDEIERLVIDSMDRRANGVK